MKERSVIFSPTGLGERGTISINAGVETMKLKNIIRLIPGFLAGAVALNTFAIPQKIVLGADPLVLKGTIVPTLFGGFVGAIIAYMFRQKADRANELLRANKELSREIVERKEAEKAIVKAKEEWERTFDSVPDLVTITDKQYRIVRINKAMADRSGLSPEEATGATCYEVFHGTDGPPAVCPYARLLKDGQEHTAEMFEARLGGTFSVSASPILGADGEITGCVQVARDITDLKRVEESLRDQEQTLRGILAASPVGIARGKDRKITWINEAWADMFGLYAASEHVGKGTRMLYSSEEDYTRVGEALYEDLGQGGVKEIDVKLVRRDGSIFDGHMRLANFDSSDPLKGVIIACSDISERNKGEQERLRLATAIEQSAESILVTDADGTIQYVNPSFERITGYSRKEAVGRNPCIVKSDRHDKAFYRNMWETLAAGEVWRGHLINKKRDGTLYEEDATISPVKDESGTIVNYVAVKRDVTGEVLLEKQLQQAQKMEAIGTLAGGIAHDFNNLLQVIQGNVDIGLLKLGKGRPGPSEFQEIRRAARSAADLTEGLLTFSRHFESKLRPVDLNHELEQVAKMLNRTISKMIAIELNLADDLDTINGDPAQLQQVVMNLAVNARDAMPGGGELHIQTQNAQLDAEYCKLHLGTKPGRYVLVSVTDSGFGMEKEIVEHIFEPFFTTKGLGEGTGLGLSIAYGIVQSHGGSITCYSEPGEGTTFKVYLPTMGNQVDTEESRDADFLPRGHETILLVEDEEAIRNSGESILSLFGYSVLTAANGREGLELYREKRHEIALVILDLIMPEMSGRDCLREILSIDPNAKVLIASGYTANGRIDQALREKARAFLRKPYEAQSMLRLVREVLDAEMPDGHEALR